MNKISLKLCKFSPRISLNSLDSDLRKIIEPCNLFMAKVRDSQGTWVRKTQGQSGNFAKKNWAETQKKCHTILQNSQS